MKGRVKIIHHSGKNLRGVENLFVSYFISGFTAHELEGISIAKANRLLKILYFFFTSAFLWPFLPLSLGYFSSQFFLMHSFCPVFPYFSVLLFLNLSLCFKEHKTKRSERDKGEKYGLVPTS